MSSPKEVAQYMAHVIKSSGIEHERDLIPDVEDQFGSDGVETDKEGNAAIRRDVLEEFWEAESDSIEWDEAKRSWKHRVSFKIRTTGHPHDQ